MVMRDIRVEKVRKNFYITLIVLITVLAVTYIFTRPLKVVKVTKGDLLVLNNGKKVRLIGVDAVKQAKSFVEEMVEGKEIELKYDRQRIDSKGHIRAYVYLLDGIFLNAEVIKEGYAYVNREFTFQYFEQFRQYEQEAKEEKKGMWADLYR
jgi:micrococcal nuclease